MEELFDRTGDFRDAKLVSDAVINLYAAHVHSLLYPYNHPLISDSLKNAFQGMRKVFHRKPTIRLETVNGRLMLDGEILEGDVAILGHFASWINTMNIKTLSFARGLTRRELISFHKIISTKKLNIDDLSNIMVQKSIVNISVHTLDSSVENARISSADDLSHREHTKDFENTMYLGENNQAQSPFFIRPAKISPHDDAANYGFIKDSEIKEYQTETHGDLSHFGIDTDEKESVQRMSEGDRYAEYVETLIERDVSEEDYSVICGIPPQEMAHLMNTMLFSVPRSEVVERVMRAYFHKDKEIHAEDTFERCKIFLFGLKSYLRPSFLLGCNSIFGTNETYLNQLLDMFPEAGQEVENLSMAEVVGKISSEKPVFVPCRTIEGSDFTFDFVTSKNAVLHDIEISSETARLFNEEHIANYQKDGVLDAISSSVRAAANDAKFQSNIIMECTDEAITDAFFDVMIELLESHSLDDDLYGKLEARSSALVELFSEKGELENVLHLFNAMKTQSLQGKCCDHASAMIRSVFSSDKVNAKVVDTLRRYGRKRRDSAYKLTSSLQSFIIPYLLDALCEESNTSTRRFIMSLLTSVRSEAIDHIAKRLRGSSWYVLRNMLYLLRECRGRSHKKAVRSFLEHELPLVRLEALRTLLSFQDPEAEPYLIKFLGSNLLQLQKGAVRLTGAYRIKKAVPHLVSLLKEKDIRGKSFSFKRGIVRALGRIGDSRAVSHLLNICRSKSGIYKDELDKLKIEIFRTLHNYPATTVGPLIEYGIHSDNKEILAISEKLMKRYGLSTVKQS